MIDMSGCWGGTMTGRFEVTSSEETDTFQGEVKGDELRLGGR